MKRVAEFVSSSPEETLRLAARFTGGLSPGSVVALSGPLGAGKTLFVKGMAAALGVSRGETTSPTFTIINEYDGALPLYHIDLYRLEEPADILDLGLDEYFDGGGITALEWAERAEFLLPSRTVSVSIARRGDGGRTITIVPRRDE